MSDEDEPDLFEAYARRTDPKTSHNAADSLDEQTLSHMESIALEAAWRCGLRGMINDDLVRITGLPWKSITPRMAPLERKGFVWKRIDPLTGKPATRPGASGRGQEIYFATGPKGVIDERQH